MAPVTISNLHIIHECERERCGHSISASEIVDCRSARSGIFMNYIILNNFFILSYLIFNLHCI